MKEQETMVASWPRGVSVSSMMQSIKAFVAYATTEELEFLAEYCEGLRKRREVLYFDPSRQNEQRNP